MKQILLLLIIITTNVFCIDPIVPVIIIDTDIGPWPDDVTALAIIHSFMDQNKTTIRAIMANDRYEGIVPVIESINNYFNHSNIKIGITKDLNAYDSGNNLTWPNFILKNFQHSRYQRNDEAENAITLYRRLLSISNDHSVIILSIGFFTNLANLLNTDGDEYSSLNGRELIKKKVNKMIAMAGEYPMGQEWNIEKQVHSAQQIIDRWPTSIIFAGAEVGRHLKCWKNILNNNKLSDDSPIKKAWIIAKNEMILDGCYDEIAAFIAINGVEPYYKLIYGNMKILPNGTNIWQQSLNNRPTRMAYIKQIINDQDIINAMDSLYER